MIGSPRLRRLAPYGAALALALALGACAREYPNTTFMPHSEYGRAIDFLWNRLLFLGTLVFIFVECVLLFVVFKYRRRNDDIMPPQTHGNTALEITWTLIPAAILVFIAVPTVRTIFQTQTKAPANALQIEVYGHQWWWEFRYPEYNIVTANEIYLPTGRTVNFALRTKDVIHSFWIPQLSGKRDLISNRTNYIWFTPDTKTPTTVWNGFCTEYCGASHANMRFRVVTVTPEQFTSWVSHQQAPAFFNTAPAPAAPAAVAAATSTGQTNTAAPAATPATPVPAAATNVPTAAQLASFILPKSQVPAYAIPQTPLPDIQFNDDMQGDPARGQQLFTGAGTCNACHAIQGNPLAVGNIGPNLTHVASRIAIGGGLYMNDSRHLARWIKNARVMKPGNIMPTLGKGQFDPQTNMKVPGGLDDQQIADIVAYLQALK
jgi:cytochrome c oxidase subunit 2